MITKHLYPFLSLFILIGCTPPPEARYTEKPMPAAEQAFLKKLGSADSVYDAQKNDITKKETLEKGKAEIEQYILNNLTVNNWVGIVHDIEVGKALVDYIKVEVFLPIGNWREEKRPEYSYPVLIAVIDTKESKIKEALKSLEKGDEVFISGEIKKTLDGKINIVDYSNDLSEFTPFSNLSLDLKITDIKKSYVLKP